MIPEDLKNTLLDFKCDKIKYFDLNLAMSDSVKFSFESKDGKIFKPYKCLYCKNVYHLTTKDSNNTKKINELIDMFKSIEKRFKKIEERNKMLVDKLANANQRLNKLESKNKL